MRAIVSAPDLRRAAHGLVESANRPQPDARWEQGLSFTPRGCNVIFGHEPACPSGEWSNFQNCLRVDAQPWVLEASLVWATADLAANPKGILAEAMAVGTSAVLERLTSSGVAGVASGTPINPPTVAATLTVGGIKGRDQGTPPPTLASVGLVDAGPFSARAAVGAVEAKLLDAADHIGQAGTLMMSPKVAVEIADLLEERGGKLHTRTTGSLVVVGNFAPPTTVWGVAGEVDVYLSDIEVVEVHEHRSNELVLQASRFAVAAWGTCATFGATVGP